MNARKWIFLLFLGCILLLAGLYHIQASAAVRRETVQTSVMREEKKIALTFDDGPHPVYTEQLLDGLKKRSVKATFFILGEQAEMYPDIVKRIGEEGHLIGNHTYSHLQYSPSREVEFGQELVKTNEILKDITGQEVMFVRPPYGSWNKKYETQLNMFPVLWTIDPLDWTTSNVLKVVRGVLAKASENDIILMHDCYQSTVTAALEVIDTLQKEGFVFVTVEELLFD